ncbi:lytic transglycosylase domain-containing protein [Mesorhizobium sp. INR15]|uniref:lytic transglycosylase domain-containing protein n=1 Tax=Mesorhizobium sp. INR15 TaxID=2654248 RepID=UPI00189695CC|nr:lytic transglycosylase domain-containing protein [Mesorhizobium sp. INR15]QPC91365.1 transglycosylase SLT domain-containing protein [Mesorhizobium sp. INR15]
MPARLNLIAIGVIVGVAGLSGCTSTSQMKPAPSFTETVAAAGADAGFTIPLPETVTVLPESSGIAPVQTAELPLDPAAQPANAFAGPTPLAVPAVPAVMTAGAAPAVVKTNATAASAYAIAGVAPAAGKQATLPLASGTAAQAGVMPGVQQVAYVVPRNPAALVQFPAAPVQQQEEPHATGVRGDVDRLIVKYAALYQVPVDLVRHVVNRESTFNPKAYNNGHWGLMQIKHATARGMGYDGPAKGLFDAETNLKYAVKYLRGAWLVSDGNAKRADWLYQTGYYFDAKRKGLLEATGLGVDRQRRRAQPVPDA